MARKRLTVELDQVAQEQFDQLREKHRRQAKERILGLELDPRPRNAVRFSDHANGPVWRLRFGDFRIIYQIRDRVLIVLVLMIGDRKSVYRELRRRRLI